MWALVVLGVEVRVYISGQIMYFKCGLSDMLVITVPFILLVDSSAPRYGNYLPVSH